MFSCLWKCIPTSVVWEIWLERNKRIFREMSSPIPQILEGLERSIVELVNASVSKYKGKYVFSPWDGYIIQRWKGLLFPHLPTPLFPSKIPLIHAQTKLIPPSEGYLKLNFDGASRRNLGNSSYGIVIRDFKGHVITTKSSSLPLCTNNKVEALALLFGLELEKSLSISKLHVEGDLSIKWHVCNWSI